MNHISAMVSGTASYLPLDAEHPLNPALILYVCHANEQLTAQVFTHNVFPIEHCPLTTSSIPLSHL